MRSPHKYDLFKNDRNLRMARIDAPPEYRPWIMLVEEMILTAVEDLRKLPLLRTREGKNGSLRINSEYIDSKYGKRLLEFFRHGGAMDYWLRAAHIDVSGCAIRRQLGIEREG